MKRRAGLGIFWGGLKGIRAEWVGWCIDAHEMVCLLAFIL